MIEMTGEFGALSSDMAAGAKVIGKNTSEIVSDLRWLFIGVLIIEVLSLFILIFVFFMVLQQWRSLRESKKVRAVGGDGK